MSYIYKISSTETDTVYIGQTVQDVHKRWLEHQWYAKRANSPLAQAIQLHGVETFKIEIIEECAPEDLASREMYWIAQHPNNFNVTDHPRTYQTGQVLEYDHNEIIDLYVAGMSKAKIGERIGVSATTVARVLKQHDVPSHTYNPGTDVDNRKPVIVNELNKRFDSIGEAAEYLAPQFGVSVGTVRQNISKCLNGKKASYKKLTFSR